MKRKLTAGTIVIAILVGLWSVLAAIPVIIAVFSSLKSPTDIITNPLSLPLHPTFHGYAEAIKGTLGGEPMTTYLLNSAIAVAVGLVFGISCAVLVGYHLARVKSIGAGISRTYFLILLTLPPVVTFVPLFTLTGHLGIRNSPWGLGLVYAAANLPLAVVLMRSFFLTFPGELIEAARLDGATERRLFFTIILPLMRGAIGTVSLLTGIGMWNELALAVVLLNNSNSYTVPVGLSLYRSQFQVDFGAQFAGLVIAVLPALIAYAVFNKQFIEGLRAGAVK